MTLGMRHLEYGTWNVTKAECQNYVAAMSRAQDFSWCYVIFVYLMNFKTSVFEVTEAMGDLHSI